MSDHRDHEEFDLRPTMRTVARNRVAIIVAAFVLAALAVAAVTISAGSKAARARIELIAPNNAAAGIIAKGLPAAEVSRLTSDDLANKVADQLHVTREELNPIEVHPIDATSFIDVAVHAPSASVATTTLQTYLDLYRKARVETFDADVAVERSLASKRLTRTKTALADTEALLNSGTGTGSIVLQTRIGSYLGQIADTEQTIAGIDEAVRTGPLRLVTEPEVDRLTGHPARIPAAIAGFVLGVILASAAALALELLRNRIRSRRDVVNASPGLVVIGEVARPKRGTVDQLSEAPSVSTARSALVRVAQAHGFRQIVCVATDSGSAEAEVAALAATLPSGMALTVAQHPVHTAADAHALAAADAAVIIVRTGATTRRRLAGAVEDLAAQRITIVGAVLFDLDPDDVGQSVRTYRATGAAIS